MNRIVVLLAMAASVSADWPQFRGPGSAGVGAGTHPERWSATENVAWKAELPGRGWSSPVVVGNKVFLTTVVNTGKAEAPKKGLYFGGDRPKPSSANHQWKVFCLDLQSGKTLWEKQVHEGPPKTPIHVKGSYAAETPAADAQRVVCCFGGVGLWCFDHAGKELWKRPLEAHPMRFGWGAAASPALHDGRVYYVNDNDKESYVLALDAATGKEIWKQPRQEKSNWSTPFVWKHAGRTELVVPATGRSISYALDGQPLWNFKGMSSITIATPYEHEGLLIVSSGYVGDPKRPLYAIKPGAAGDITLADGQDANAHIAWRVPQGAPYNPSTVGFDGRIYVLYDFGLLGCFDAKTGKEVFARKRIPGAKGFTASPWASGGNVYCLDEDGQTFVFRADETFHPAGTNKLADDDMGMATPALAGDRLLLRTAARLYCIAKP